MSQTIPRHRVRYELTEQGEAAVSRFRHPSGQALVLPPDGRENWTLTPLAVAFLARRSA